MAIKVSGKPSLNVVKGMKSYLILDGATEKVPFTANTKVTVTDKTQTGTITFEWEHETCRPMKNGTRGGVRLKCTTGYRDKDKDRDPPDPGTVTITVVAPNDTVMNPPVEYVNDPP
jgi:hypothetical protein